MLLGANWIVFCLESWIMSWILNYLSWILNYTKLYETENMDYMEMTSRNLLIWMRQSVICNLLLAEFLNYYLLDRECKNPDYSIHTQTEQTVFIRSIIFNILNFLLLQLLSLFWVLKVLWSTYILILVNGLNSHYYIE
jgi:hypothetical protein